MNILLSFASGRTIEKVVDEHTAAHRLYGIKLSSLHERFIGAHITGGEPTKELLTSLRYAADPSGFFIIVGNRIVARRVDNVGYYMY